MIFFFLIKTLKTFNKSKSNPSSILKSFFKFLTKTFMKITAITDPSFYFRFRSGKTSCTTYLTRHWKRMVALSLACRLSLSSPGTITHFFNSSLTPWARINKVF